MQRKEGFRLGWKFLEKFPRCPESEFFRKPSGGWQRVNLLEHGRLLEPVLVACGLRELIHLSFLCSKLIDTFRMAQRDAIS